MIKKSSRTHLTLGRDVLEILDTLVAARQQKLPGMVVTRSSVMRELVLRAGSDLNEAGNTLGSKRGDLEG